MNPITRDKIIAKIRERIKNMTNEDAKLEVMEAFGRITGMDRELKGEEEKMKENLSMSEESFEEKKHRYELAEKIRQLDKNATYVDEFVRLLAEPPFTLPSNYFEPETALTTNVEVPEFGNSRYRKEQAELAYNICFPGSITFRYGLPRKIVCGNFSRNNQADLLSRHELNEEPEEFTINGKKVYFVKTLSTQPADVNKFYVCPICLSADLDEKCDHMSKKMYLKKSPSNFPIKENVEIHRITSPDSKIFPSPLSNFISKVEFLSELKIGTAYTGFTRSVGTTITQVDYEPYIGYVTKTRGVSFHLKKISEDFLNYVLDQTYLARDLIIDLVFFEFGEQLKINVIPRYHVELFLSAFIKSLQLDRIDQNFSMEKTQDRIKNKDWIQDALVTIQQELVIYEGRFPYPLEIQTKIFESISKIDISTESIKTRIKKLIANSLSHSIFLSACATSGSGYEDLDYSVNYDSTGNPMEILLFDASNGGNGASELVFNYLILPTEKGIIENNSESIIRPHYFDESLFEILLPCTQGTIDRIHFQNLNNLVQDSMMEKLLIHSQNQVQESPEIFTLLRNAGIQNIFPHSIGLRQIDDEQPLRETEKIREMASICIHGCPDCISLGSKAKPDQFSEKYSISKYLLDLFFRYNFNNLLLESRASIDMIKQKLSEFKTAILVKKIMSVEDYDDFDKIISDLIGKEIKNEFIKLSGKWYDCHISNKPFIEIFCILGLV